MGGTIDQVKSNIASLAQSIAKASSDYRFALVDYKDGSDQGDPYRAQVDLGFTTDVTAFSSAASVLSASGGGDYPESMYSGAMTALGLPWRNGVHKVVIVIGDAPGKDPEPETGYTLATVRDKALAVDPAQVYTVAASSSQDVIDFMTALSNATGGAEIDGSTDIVTALQSTILAAGSAPTADAGGPYMGVTNDPVAFSAGGSRDDSEQIVGYDWDFNGDGTYDATTTDPITSHIYTDPGTYQLTMRARSASGLAGIATSTVTVTAPPAAPGAPQSLVATPGDGTVTLTWAKGSGGTPQWYTITDGTGNVIDRIGAQPDGSPPPGWVDTELTDGTAYSYKISADNVSGESAPVGPVTATPELPNRPPVAIGDTYSTNNQTRLVVQAPGVLTNDSDPDGDKITASLKSTSTHGTLSLNSDGSFAYTPKKSYIGTDSFSYAAVDVHGAVSNTVNATITITPQQQLLFAASGVPPIILSGKLTTGYYSLTMTKGQVNTLTGTGSISEGRNATASVVLDIQKKGLHWNGTATVTTASDKKRVLVGSGIVWHAGLQTGGTFTSGRISFSFIITDPPRS